MTEAMGPVQTIGVPMPLVDGPEKVSGKALYTADFITQDELVGRILRSPVAHARIVSVDTSAAEALLLGGTRDAVDDFARDRTSRLGSTFGLHRFSLPQFARPA